jgi:hypothetical protein
LFVKVSDVFFGVYHAFVVFVWSAVGRPQSAVSLNELL